MCRISLVKLRPDVDRDEVLRLWLGPHADVVRALPGVRGYVIGLAAEPRGVDAWDAVATLRFDSRAEMEATLGDPDVRRALERTREPFLQDVDAFVVGEHVVIDAATRR